MVQFNTDQYCVCFCFLFIIVLSESISIQLDITISSRSWDSLDNSIFVDADVPV